MLKLDLDIHECHGPAGWGGPAVTVPREKVAEIVRGTTVKLDSHGVGEHVMLYPAPVRR
jgi:hypothetical protein